MFLDMSRSSPAATQHNSQEYLNLKNIYFWHLKIISSFIIHEGSFVILYIVHINSEV